MQPAKYNKTGSAGKGSVQGQVCVTLSCDAFHCCSVFGSGELRIENRYHSYEYVLREVCAEAEVVDQRGSMWINTDEDLMDAQCL